MAGKLARITASVGETPSALKIDAKGGYSLLLALGLQNEVVSLVYLVGEVRAVRQQLVVVDSVFVQQHAGHPRSVLLAKSLYDESVDGVSNEVVTVRALEIIQL